MDLFFYLDRGTWLHRLDPRTKLVGLLAWFMVALLFSDPRYLALPIVLVLIAAFSAGALPNLRRMWWLLMLLFLYCLLLWPLFLTGHTPLFSIGSYILTREAVGYGIGMGLRLDLMLMAGIVLLTTTTLEEFTLALHRLGIPGPASFALSLAFRWVPTLIGAAQQIVQAQRSRGLDLTATHGLARIRRYPPLLVPLIGHTIRQTRLLAMALESKGFGPEARRSRFLELRLRALDYLTLIGIFALVALSIWLRSAGHGAIEVQF